MFDKLAAKMVDELKINKNKKLKKIVRIYFFFIKLSFTSNAQPAKLFKFYRKQTI